MRLLLKAQVLFCLLLIVVGFLVRGGQPFTLSDTSWPNSTASLPIPTPDAWWKADAITGLSDGNSVSNWIDSIGSHDMAQTNSWKQPTYKTNVLNGLPVVRFASNCTTNSDWMQSSLTVSNPATVFMVYDTRDVAGVWGKAFAGNNNVWFGPYSGHHYFYNLSFIDGGAAVNNTFVRATALQTATGREFWINGTSAGTNGNNASFGVAYFSDPEGSGCTALAGDIAECIVYQRNVPTSERTNIEAYLKTKWGL